MRKRLVCFLLAAAMLLAAPPAQAAEDDFIRWVDFNLTAEAMERAIALEQRLREKEIPVSWLDILALGSVRSGGKRFSAKDAEKAAAELSKGVSPEELLSETLLLREPGSGTRSILERELMQVSYSTAAFSRTICISSFPVIRALTAANCGISFLYEAVVRGSPEIGSFTCPPLTGRHELNVVFLQHTGAGSLAREFVAPVMEQFP